MFQNVGTSNSDVGESLKKQKIQHIRMFPFCASKHRHAFKKKNGISHSLITYTLCWYDNRGDYNFLQYSVMHWTMQEDYKS